MATRILVIGGSGQLGTELQRARLPVGCTLLVARRSELDLAEPGAVRQALAAFAPDAVINAAAYTFVDKAEVEPAVAMTINRYGAAALAQAAAALNAPLVHLSTDYVFDGRKPSPYLETDEKSPICAYGVSKAEGEDAVLAAYPEATVLRTSWVFSPHRANFVKTMLTLGETRDEVRVVEDQVGRPTYAADLAVASLAMMQHLLNGEHAARGVFHFSGAGDTTWADFAEAIFSEAEKRGRRRVRVQRIPTSQFPTLAKRPANSRLDTTKITGVLGAAPRPWREALNDCLDQLLAR